MDGKIWQGTISDILSQLMDDADGWYPGFPDKDIDRYLNWMFENYYRMTGEAFTFTNESLEVKASFLFERLHNIRVLEYID